LLNESIKRISRNILYQNWFQAEGDTCDCLDAAADLRIQQSLRLLRISFHSLNLQLQIPNHLSRIPKLARQLCIIFFQLRDALVALDTFTFTFFVIPSFLFSFVRHLRDRGANWSVPRRSLSPRGLGSCQRNWGLKLFNLLLRSR